MDSIAIESDEFSVDEGAFWHTNMDLFYGYVIGEVVEVQHEPGKYWLASIEYCFKHLVLLKWIGNFGEFWVDTSLANNYSLVNSNNISTSTSSAFNELNTNPQINNKLFPLGHHLQTQLKSHFKLEKPTKILIKPSLYNPSKDPYAEIRTVDDLLALDDEVDQNAGISLNINQSTSSNIEPTNLVLAKCKTKINYGQEDVDELEAALQVLNEIDNADGCETADNIAAQSIDKPSETQSGIDSIGTQVKLEKIETKPPPTTEVDIKKEGSNDKEQFKNNSNNNNDEKDDISDEVLIDLCKSLQDSAINKGFYNGVDASKLRTTSDIFHLKPKQFFDVGGANQERVFLPGTLLEVSHVRNLPDGSLGVYHWFAYVMKNLGGRLTLRWFVADDPKYRQGRLELKYQSTSWINEGEWNHTDNNASSKPPEIEEPTENGPKRLSTDDITFCLHFCDPKIHNMHQGQILGREYKLPDIISSYLEPQIGSQPLLAFEECRIRSIFDSRRLNLDRDRPLINHILTTARNKAPNYLKIEFHPNDNPTDRAVLISCSEMTKLLKGFLIREIDPGVFEVHSEPSSDNQETIKFVYPYDSSYAILPVDWAKNNQDCLSVGPSRERTPTDLDNVDNEQDQEIHHDKNDEDPSTFKCSINSSMKSFVESKFKVMDQLTVVHPSSDTTICLGRIRKVVYPLMWIQISPDCYTLLPFNSTNVYSSTWCETYGHPYVSLLPPRKRCLNQLQAESGNRKKKKVKVSIKQTEEQNNHEDQNRVTDQLFEKEHFDLGALSNRQTELNYILNEKSNYIKIYFNHKCFTGPSLSKSKICSLPQYVGPGPLRLVMEEVITKIISVAYVPPRILNDLSSGVFEKLLYDKGLTNTRPMEFKAKYQKRVHREDIPVCISPDDVDYYCELLCEHIKCCFNLFGLNSYDGDFCPSHCRTLTKSNKFMKRATYYRDKARAGEYLGTNKTANNNGQSNSSNSNNRKNDTPRNKNPTNDNNIDNSSEGTSGSSNSSSSRSSTNDENENNIIDHSDHEPAIKSVVEKTVTKGATDLNDVPMDEIKSEQRQLNVCEFPCYPTMDALQEQLDETHPRDWTIEDVGRYLEWCKLGCIKERMKSEGIDGRALLLFDHSLVKEHFRDMINSGELKPRQMKRLSEFISFSIERAHRLDSWSLDSRLE